MVNIDLLQAKLKKAKADRDLAFLEKPGSMEARMADDSYWYARNELIKAMEN